MAQLRSFLVLFFALCIAMTAQGAPAPLDKKKAGAAVGGAAVGGTAGLLIGEHHEDKKNKNENKANVYGNVEQSDDNKHDEHRKEAQAAAIGAAVAGLGGHAVAKHHEDEKNASGGQQTNDEHEQHVKEAEAATAGAAAGGLGAYAVAKHHEDHKASA